MSTSAAARSERILREVTARFDTRTTDGSEAAELLNATLTWRDRR
jgi:hypothetical protein